MNRKLLLLRHGTAEPYRADDAERALVDKGRRQIVDAARWLERTLLVPERIICSPYLRAVQTAQIVAERFALPLSEDGSLVPHGRTGSVRKRIIDAFAEGCGSLMLVGHEPLLSFLALEICEGGQIELRKGGLIELEVTAKPPLHGRLLGVLRPRHLRDLISD